MQKTTLLILLIGVLVAGCQKADEASEIVGDKQPMLEIIPTAKLGEWDEGYLINSSIVFAFKHIDKTEKEDGHYVGFFTTNVDGGADKVDSYDVAFEADEEFNVRCLSAGDDSWHYEYVKDSVYVTHYNKDSDEYERKGYKNNRETVLLPKTKGISSDLKVVGSLIGFWLGDAAGFANDASIRDFRKAFIDMGQSTLLGLAITATLAPISPMLAVSVLTILTAIDIGTTLYDIYKKNREYPYLGNANTHITQFTEKKITISLSDVWTLPNDKKVICVLAIKNVGIIPSARDVPISSADYSASAVVTSTIQTFSCDVPELKFGYYIATPYLICDGHLRAGVSAGLYCNKLDKLPSYSIYNYDFKSQGVGKLELSVWAQMSPLDFDFNSQFVFFQNVNGSSVLTLGSQPSSKYNDSNISELQLNDLRLDYERKTAQLEIKPVYMCVVDYQGSIVFYYDLPHSTLTYSEKSLIRFENVRIDRTEKHTEKKKSVMGNISLGNSSPNPNPDPDEDDEITYYETYFTASYTLEGGFWIKTVANECTGTVSTSGLTVISSGKSGKYKDKFKGVLKYNSEKEINDASISCRMTLMNGETVNSINSLLFSGGEEITDAICK